MFKKFLFSLLISSLFAVPFVSAQNANSDYYLKVEWGVFNADGTASNLPPSDIKQPFTDMSGFIRFTNAAVKFMRPLNFDKEDKVQGQPLDPSTTTFTSKINDRTDGLLFRVSADSVQAGSLYYQIVHEGRNVTLNLADLLVNPKMEYVIDSKDKYKIFFELLSSEQAAQYLQKPGKQK